MLDSHGICRGYGLLVTWLRLCPDQTMKKRKSLQQNQSLISKMLPRRQRRVSEHLLWHISACLNYTTKKIPTPVLVQQKYFILIGCSKYYYAIGLEHCLSAAFGTGFFIFHLWGNHESLFGNHIVEIFRSKLHKYKLNKTYPSKAQILHDCGVTMFGRALTWDFEACYREQFCCVN